MVTLTPDKIHREIESRRTVLKLLHFFWREDGRPGAFQNLSNCAEGASFSATQGFKRLVSVCSCVTDFSDFCRRHLHRLHPLFPLLVFQLGFSGIPENDEKTSISPSAEWSQLTLFWDPFWSLFFWKSFVFPSKGETAFPSLRRNPARRVNLV